MDNELRRSVATENLAPLAHVAQGAATAELSVSDEHVNVVPSAPELRSTEDVCGSELGRKEDEMRDDEEIGNSKRTSSNVELQASQPASELSPGAFRSVAALAGWDEEALFLATLKSPEVAQEGQETSDRCIVRCGHCTVCRERKRDVRTPLSSARRHRRVRWQGTNGSPLGRVPMKALPPLHDNDAEIHPAHEANLQASFIQASSCCTTNRHQLTTEQREDVGSGSSVPRADIKENCDGFITDALKSIAEDKPSKPLCLDELREELSCAVCLDICFKPSTVPCGHSFCRKCLQSVLRKCGPRCPKCRQSLGYSSIYPVNTVLWNTIKILFPQESAARESIDKERSPENNITDGFIESDIGTVLSTSRHQPLQTSNMHRSRRLGPHRYFVPASELLLMPRTTSASNYDAENPRRRSNGERMILPETRSLLPRARLRNSPASQERVDAALAARLQNAELMEADDLTEHHTRSISSLVRSNASSSTRNRRSVATAAANLRSVASRAVNASHRRSRTQT